MQLDTRQVKNSILDSIFKSIHHFMNCEVLPKAGWRDAVDVSADPDIKLQMILEFYMSIGIINADNASKLGTGYKDATEDELPELNQELLDGWKNE